MGMENSDARRLNRAAILRMIVADHQITRQQIALATALSKATVSRLVRELISEGLLAEGPIVASPDGGRWTQILEFRGNAGRVCGVDMGGSNTRFVLADLRARLVRAWTEPTPRSKSAVQLADWIAGRILEVDVIGDAPVITACGVPGAVVPTEGRILNAPNLPQVEGVVFSSRLARRLPGDVRLENDTNIALSGEMCAGAGVGTKDAVMFTIGTGLGAGVFIDGALLTGRHGLAGEFGLVPVAEGRTLESTLSAPGVVELARALRVVGGDAKTVLMGRSRKHDDLRQYVADALYLACTIVRAAYEPDRIILGGAVAPSLIQLLPGVNERLERQLAMPPSIVMSALGDYAGAVGAVAIALESAYQLLGATAGGIFDPLLRDDLADLVARVRETDAGSMSEHSNASTRGDLRPHLSLAKG